MLKNWIGLASLLLCLRGSSGTACIPETWMPRLQGDLKIKWTRQEQGLCHIASLVSCISGCPLDARALQGAMGCVSNSENRRAEGDSQNVHPPKSRAHKQSTLDLSLIFWTFKVKGDRVCSQLDCQIQYKTLSGI